jgi:hypothetical protein
VLDNGVDHLRGVLLPLVEDHFTEFPAAHFLLVVINVLLGLPRRLAVLSDQ